MKKVLIGLVYIFLAFVVIGCGGEEKNTSDNRGKNTSKLLRVSGVEYRTSSGIEGIVNERSEFTYNRGDDVEFFIGNLLLGHVKNINNVITFDDFDYPLKVAQFLLTLDSDHYSLNGIQIDKKLLNYFKTFDNQKIRSNQNFDVLVFDDESLQTQELIENINQDIGQDYESVEKDTATNFIRVQLAEENMPNDEYSKKIWKVLTDENYYNQSNYYINNRYYLNNSSSSRLSLYFYQTIVSDLINNDLTVLSSRIDGIGKAQIYKDNSLKYYSYAKGIYDLLNWKKNIWGALATSGFSLDATLFVLGADKEFPAISAGVKAATSCALDIVTSAGKACVVSAFDSFYNLSILGIAQKDYNDIVLAQYYLEDYYKCSGNNACLRAKYEIDDISYSDVNFDVLDQIIKKKNLGIISNSSIFDSINGDMRLDAASLIRYYQNLIYSRVEFVQQTLGLDNLDAYFISDTYDKSKNYNATKFMVYGGTIDKETGKNLKFNFQIKNKASDIYIDAFKTFTLDIFGERVYIPNSLVVIDENRQYDFNWINDPIIGHNKLLNGQFILQLDDKVQNMLYTYYDKFGNPKGSQIFFEIQFRLIYNNNKEYTQKEVIYFDPIQNLETLQTRWSNPKLLLNVDNQDIIVDENERVCINSLLDLGAYTQSDLIDSINIKLEQFYGDDVIDISSENSKSEQSDYISIEQKYCFTVPEVKGTKEHSILKFRLFASTNESFGEEEIVKIQVNNKNLKTNQKPTVRLKSVSTNNIIKLHITAKDDNALSKIKIEVKDLVTHQTIKTQIIPLSKENIKDYSTTVTIDKRDSKYEYNKTYKIYVTAYDNKNLKSFWKVKVFHKRRTSSKVDEQLDIDKTNNTISGKVTTEDGRAIPDINIKFEYTLNKQVNYVKDETTMSGSYSIAISNEQFEHGFNIVYAYDNNNLYKPVSKELKKIDGQTSYLVNFIMEPMSENIINIDKDESENQHIVTHLGDNNFGKDGINNQIPKDATLKKLALYFEISENQFNGYQNAEITYMAQGVQKYNNTFILNNSEHSLATNSNDDYKLFTVKVDKSEYHIGINKLLISSGKNSSGDFDDFRFTNIQMKFLDPIEPEEFRDPIVTDLEFDLSNNDEFRITISYDYASTDATLYFNIISPNGIVSQNSMSLENVNQYVKKVFSVKKYALNDVFDESGIYTVEALIIDPVKYLSSNLLSKTVYLDISTSVSPVINYGAIAYSSSSSLVGASYEASSADKASELALADCYKSDCNVKIIGSSGECIAIASDSTIYNGAGWGVAETKQEAEEAALYYCVLYNSSGCVNRISFCIK